MENGFSLNTRLTCLSCPRYHVFRATRITADFTVGSSDMSNTRWKKKLKEGFCEELFPSRSHRKHREQVIETRAKSPYFQSITRTVSFFFLLTRPTPDWRLNPTRTAEQRSFFSYTKLRECHLLLNDRGLVSVILLMWFWWFCGSGCLPLSFNSSLEKFLSVILREYGKYFEL